MSNKLRNPNRLRNAVVIGLLGLVGVTSAALGLKHLDDIERSNYERDQRAAAAVLQPALVGLGERALGFATASKGGPGVTMGKDTNGNYVITFTTEDSYQKGDGKVVMGAGSNGKPDPAKTVFAQLHSRSDYHISDIALVAPDGQQYDTDHRGNNRGAETGYEGRLATGVDLDGDGDGDDGRVLDTTERMTAYGMPAQEQAEGVAEAAELELNGLGRGVVPPTTPTPTPTATS